MKCNHRSIVVILIFGLSASPIFAQGSLTPPGAPTPTMKTLDQVEARQIVNATNTPGDGTDQFVISAPGSYYLTGNITGVSGKNGIVINADDVTLDLNGFALIGVGGSLRGIFVPLTHRNLRIYNGIAHNWGVNGMNCTNGINCQFDHLLISQSNGFLCGPGCVINSVSVDGNGSGGFTTGDHCTLTGCSATGNLTGFTLGSNCTIMASTAVGNGGGGINAGPYCTIIGCTATTNTGNGIITSSDCTIKDCTVSSNHSVGIYTAVRCLIVNCTANSNGNDGIYCDGHSTVKLCNASSNTRSGIEAAGDCLISENQFNNNVLNGIYTSGNSNRVDSNHTNYNGGYGILSSGTDWVIRNTSGNNASGNYFPTSGATIGPIQTASTATNPYANLQ